MALVLDASLALAWCFPDEATAYADAVLDLLRETEALVPVIWPLEVANALVVAERRQRLMPVQTARFVELLRSLPITAHDQGVDRALGPILALAREYGLSSYDACYLNLAMELGLPLATRDGPLGAAATRAGVLLVQPRWG